jgi:RHS repeat-associated protein
MNPSLNYLLKPSVMHTQTTRISGAIWSVLVSTLILSSAVQAQTQSQTTVITKNAQGQTASVTDAMGGKVDYQYDALGNLVQTNAAGSITTIQYNQRGQKIAMQDPAMGSWTYGYNAFGELVSQRDSLNQTANMAYDALGRLTQRTESDLVSEWSYDKKFDGAACGKSVGKLCEAKADNNYKRTHTYDSLGRPSSTTTVLDNVASPEVVSATFDVNTGRVVGKTWPTGYQASYSYTPTGYLSGVTGGGTNGFSQTTSYQILGMTPQGQITKYRTGNNVTTVRTYDPLVENMSAQVVTTDGQAAGNVLNQAYRFDALGNLLTRLDNTPGVGTQESFSYDSLNRLTTASILGGAVSPPTTTEVMYDQRGNITYKSDVGRYWYDSARPDRMTQVTLETATGATVSLTGTRALSYAFDDSSVNAQNVNGTTVGNGNLTYTVSQDMVNGRHTLRYESQTSFNMPSQIVYGNFVTNTSSTADRTLSFVYGPEHQRIKQNVALSGNGTSSYYSGNTWYLNGEDSLGLSYEKEVRANGTIEHKHYLSAGGLAFALFTSRTGSLNGLPATTTSYFHQDHLGSIAVITDETGEVRERLAYDPWGKRRFIGSTPGLPDNIDTIVGVKTDRGYTMHEHLDEVGVIHMNGRIYDPLMGRFMSADSYIQAPDMLQSYNRYSYVINNPLNKADPTGHFWGWVAAIVAEVAYQVGAISEKDARTIQAIGIGMQTGAWALKATGGNVIAAGAIGGAASGFVGSNGDMQATAQGAFTGALFGWAGTTGTGADDATRAASFERYAAHATAGCVSSVAGGQECGRGATSAVFGKWATNLTSGSGFAAEFSSAVVAGGVGSVIAGGKFENGATTAAYGYLFNEMLTRANGEKYKSSGRMYRGDVSLSDGVAMSPQMAKEFYGVVNDGLDVCGIVHALCRAAGSVMDYTEGAINLVSNGNGNKLAATALGDGTANVLTTSLNSAMKVPGAARLPAKLIDGMAHVQATATSKAFEASDKK